MYHSITLGDKNTWDDWHLIPASRPLFNPPTVKTNYIEIPGGDGILDLTEALTGRPTYNNRTGSWNFYVQNGFKGWTALYSEIMGYLHGREMKAVLEDDPVYCYEGRFSVNAWRSDPQRSTIVIDYNVAPYKKYVYGGDQEWLWDTFNFETGVIRYYKNLPVNGSLSVLIIGDMVNETPTIVSSVSGMEVIFAGNVYQLSKGYNVMKDIHFVAGDNTIVFRGNGTVTILAKGGRL